MKGLSDVLTNTKTCAQRPVSPGQSGQDSQMYKNVSQHFPCIYNCMQVKVKLYLGPLAGELSAELPFTLMHPKVCYCEDCVRVLVFVGGGVLKKGEGWFLCRVMSRFL